jgi:hypothetical protein
MSSASPPPPSSMASIPPSWAPLPPTSKGPVIELWPFLGFWLRAGGFLLLFLGTLVAIVGATPGGSCYTGVCGGYVGQAANAILAAKILWTLGLGALGAGAGIRLHWGLRMPMSSSSEETAWVMAARRTNWWLLVMSVVLMLLLFLLSMLILGSGAHIL